jgi:hypothetical protein
VYWTRRSSFYCTKIVSNSFHTNICVSLFVLDITAGSVWIAKSSGKHPVLNLDQNCNISTNFSGTPSKTSQKLAHRCSSYFRLTDGQDKMSALGGPQGFQPRL